MSFILPMGKQYFRKFSMILNFWIFMPLKLPNVALVSIYDIFCITNFIIVNINVN